MDSPKTTSSQVDVYAIVTNRIIALLEQGTVPWQKPWTEAGAPMNLISKRLYRGINFWLLLSLNYPRNLFLTWDQLKKIGGSVKQGEHGHVIVFWKTITQESSESEDQKKSVPMLRYYKVFNVDQCRDLPENLTAGMPAEPVSLPTCESILKGIKVRPVIKHNDVGAFYDITKDFINMPKKRSFKDSASYFCTFFHELVHWTGHETRLNRSTVMEMSEFGSEAYSLEELIAEMGAAYLCSMTGILDSQISNSAGYIAGWLTKLKNDKRFVIQAAVSAQKAIDFVLDASDVAPAEEIQQTESELVSED